MAPIHPRRREQVGNAPSGRARTGCRKSPRVNRSTAAPGRGRKRRSSLVRKSREPPNSDSANNSAPHGHGQGRAAASRTAGKEGPGLQAGLRKRAAPAPSLRLLWRPGNGNRGRPPPVGTCEPPRCVGEKAPPVPPGPRPSRKISNPVNSARNPNEIRNYRLQDRLLPKTHSPASFH